MASDNRTAAFQWFLSQGYSPAAAAGIVGNLVQESGVNPNVRPGDNGSAFGVAQWRGDRYTGLQNYVAQHGGTNDLQTQLGYLDYELRNRYSPTYQRVIAAQSPREATAAFALGYERPAGAQTGVAEKVDGWGNRLDAANSLYSGAGQQQPLQSSSPPVDGLLAEPKPQQQQQPQQQSVGQIFGGLLSSLQNPNANAPMLDNQIGQQQDDAFGARARQRLAQARIA